MQIGQRVALACDERHVGRITALKGIIGKGLVAHVEWSDTGYVTIINVRYLALAPPDDGDE